MSIRTKADIEEEREKLVDGLAELKERLSKETREHESNVLRKNIARCQQHLDRYHEPNK